MKASLFMNIILCSLALSDAQSWKGKASKKTTTSTTSTASSTPKATTTTTSTKKATTSIPSTKTTSASTKTATTSSTTKKTTTPSASVNSASTSKLFYEKGNCPMKLCSGSTISKSQLANFQGSFKAVTATDVQVSHPDWSITEIKALQGGVWPANDKAKSCFQMRCPTKEDITTILKKNEGKDALAIAKSNPSLNLGRIQSAVGPSAAKKTTSTTKAASTTTKKTTTSTKKTEF